MSIGWLRGALITLIEYKFTIDKDTKKKFPLKALLIIEKLHYIGSKGSFIFGNPYPIENNIFVEKQLIKLNEQEE